MSFRTPAFCILLLLGIILLARPAYAFGAGNIASISQIEGSNWRHGDIEDTLLTLLTARAMGGKKFSKLDVKRVYFGNWLRDYSQAVDVGTVKNVSAEAIRLLLWILGFMSFGYGTGEFEVTADRLGCYRPEEHIDNPKDYADNVDARQYDQRLRGPVDEQRELAVDSRTGLKHYIATEDVGITTSSGMVRQMLRKSIELGRKYAKSKIEDDFYEALRLLGTATHCLEDYEAHSNYIELALIELGETNVFPHCGRRTQIRLQGAREPVYPIVTGTFGGVDFLHSVLGEVSDKATQSEVQELEGTIQQSKRQDNSMLKKILAQLPSGFLGSSDAAGKTDELEANAQSAHLENMTISPKQPEAFTIQAQQISKQILPIMEFHDTIMQHINETIEKIPVLPSLIESLQDQINMWVFGLIAQFILPIINQVKAELQTGSSEVIKSSKDKQLIVFHDDNSTDPTHSMLSKDHFSNVLNEPAGKVASQVLKWVIPQVVACWDDPSIDIKRTNDRIVNGVFHHPALRAYGEDGARDGRQAMFGVVEQWWKGLNERERTDLRHKLSREGVMSGKNHKEGVHDSGHGCGKPLGLPTAHTAASSGAIGGIPIGAVLGGLSTVAAAGDFFGGETGQNAPHAQPAGHPSQNQNHGPPGHPNQNQNHGPPGHPGTQPHHPGPGAMHGQGRHDNSGGDDNGPHGNRRERMEERKEARQERREERQERREERREERQEHRRPSASPPRRHSPSPPRRHSSDGGRGSRRGRGRGGRGGRGDHSPEGGGGILGGLLGAFGGGGGHGGGRGGGMGGGHGRGMGGGGGRGGGRGGHRGGRG